MQEAKDHHQLSIPYSGSSLQLPYYVAANMPVKYDKDQNFRKLKSHIQPVIPMQQMGEKSSRLKEPEHEAQKRNI